MKIKREFSAWFYVVLSTVIFSFSMGWVSMLETRRAQTLEALLVQQEKEVLDKGERLAVITAHIEAEQRALYETINAIGRQLGEINSVLGAIEDDLGNVDGVKAGRAEKAIKELRRQIKDLTVKVG